jgi:hypothetical protein
MRPGDGAGRRCAWPCSTRAALAVGLALQACSSGEAGAPTADSAEAATRDASDDAPASYLAAESVIRTSCAFVRCHGGPVAGGAGLWFAQTGSIRGPLVNVPACEYDKMMRVAPGDPARSWVMIKLQSPQDPATHAIAFTPQPDWVPTAGCNVVETPDGGGRFGDRMPETGMYQLDSDSLAALVAWIEAGAPGPD